MEVLNDILSIKIFFIFYLILFYKFFCIYYNKNRIKIKLYLIQTKKEF